MSKKIYCPGMFDLITIGHLNIIEKATEYGDVIIGLYSDSMKKHLVNNFENRKKVLENIKGITMIIQENELNYHTNLYNLKPDFIIHADDWKYNENLKYRDDVINLIKDINCKLIEPIYTRGISTSSIITRILDNDLLRNNYIIKSKKLREIIFSDKLEFIMEAHNGISSKIVEKTGFKAIWASGLCLSASLGLRDSNEASWSQVVDTLEYMANSVDIPIIVDGDQGYGNFNNARIFCKNLEQRGIGGVIFEDKLFPKTNSFIEVAGGQELANINEFCGKIRACKDNQTNPYFVVVARLESFIAGFDVNHALERAYAYHDCWF